ncbi:MAG: NUDIX domain-containing protein [Aggregatilineales bacterium]
MRHEIVAALIIQANRILLGKRSPTRLAYPNVWDVFGGHMEPGERHSHTLVRELQEELGITPSQWIYIETLTIASSEGQDGPIPLLEMHLYLVTTWSGTPANRQLHEHTTIEWFSLAQTMHLDLAHSTYPQLFARILKP